MTQVLEREGTGSDDTAPSFVYQHTVSFEETNLVGNVYFARHVAWQGRCREMFLREHAPDIVNELARDLRLVTLRVSCEYFEELRAFDAVDIELWLAHIQKHRLGLGFAYYVRRQSKRFTAAKGFQEVACMRAVGENLTPTNVPDALAQALRKFSRQPIAA